MSVPVIRTVLLSLKKVELPACPTEVVRLLKMRNEAIGGMFLLLRGKSCVNVCAHIHAGPGRRSGQQRAWVLLHLLDPDLSKAMGTNTLTTGDYEWQDSMITSLKKAIVTKLQKWVVHRPPFGYYNDTGSDVPLWLARRQIGLSWAQSNSGIQFAKTAYQAYARIFSAVIKDQSRSTFTRSLENFCQKRQDLERGELCQLQQALLLPIGLRCGCTEANVVDKFSFVTGNLLRAVFEFFSDNVRKVPDIKAPKRHKDREDDAKTYYICGCVWASMLTRAKTKPNAKALIAAMDNMTMSSTAAAKIGLPTRHVTLKNRGGLVFASVEYYQLMCKIEDRFYSTVGVHECVFILHPLLYR